MSSSNGLPYIPPLASSGAASIDLVFWVITLVAALFSVGIVIAIVYLAWKYRRGHKVDRSNPPLYGIAIEIAWTFIPLGMAMALFVWSTAVFLVNKRMPAGAMEIYVVGKQWMWKLQHAEGRWEMNELHVPVGHPVQLTMTSEDVIHSFFVPAFRLHQDVIPGEYTRLWFTPTRVGTYDLYCAQFCGTLHSDMKGTVTVMDPGDYQKWLSTGTYQRSLVAEGESLFRQNGCSGCHGAGASVRAPTLDGLYGHPVPVQIPPAGTPPDKLRAVLLKTPATTVIADDKYIHDCIALQDKIPAGFEPIMPVFKGRITEMDIFKLTAYIKSLATTRGGGNGSPTTKYTGYLSPEEYKTRTGFVPANIKALTGGSSQNNAAGNGPAGIAPNGRMSETNQIIYGTASQNNGRTLR